MLVHIPIFIVDIYIQFNFKYLFILDRFADINYNYSLLTLISEIVVDMCIFIHFLLGWYNGYPIRLKKDSLFFFFSKKRLR